MPMVFLVAGGVPSTWHPTVSASVVALTLALVGAIHGAILARMLADPPPD